MSKPILHTATKNQVDVFLSSRNLNSIGIYGQPGSGKSYLAKYIVENLLKTSDASSHPYVEFIDCSENAGIDQIRDIKIFLQLKVPTDNKFSRCVVIEHLEYLGIPAQNALLKTIEEPPTGTVIIATTANKNNILPTISSRLQWINQLPLTKNHLSDELFSEFNQPDLERAYLISNGNISLLLDLVKTPEEHKDWLAAIDEAKELLKSTRFDKLAKIDKILKTEEYTLEQLLEAMLKIIRSVILKSTSSAKVKELTGKLNSIMIAKESLKYKPSNKLLLTSLFNKF